MAPDAYRVSSGERYWSQESNLVIRFFNAGDRMTSTDGALYRIKYVPSCIEDFMATGDATRAPRAPQLDLETENQLLEEWRQGDASALEGLLESYQPRIWSICWRTLGNAEDASDLTQDVMIKVIQGLPGFDGRSKLSTWVIRISINCCLSHLRKQKLRRHASLDAPMPGGEGSRGDRISAKEQGPAPSVERRDMYMKLKQVFQEMDAEQRLLLSLRDVHETEYAQLAEIYEVPIGTIKSRLFRAREALRSCLEEVWGQGEGSKATPGSSRIGNGDSA